MKLEHCSRASCVQIIEGLSDYASRATNNALYWQNRCCDLEEIIELFCMDAAEHEDARLQVIKQCEEQVWDAVEFPVPKTETLVSLARAIYGIRSLK